MQVFRPAKLTKKLVLFSLTMVLLLAATSPLLTPATARNDGISNTSLGCVCHSGKSTESVQVTLTGLPDNYSAGDIVDLKITITGGPEVTNDSKNLGGFNLHVTGGILSPMNDSTVQIVDNQATHKAIGNDQKSWNVTWTAPQVESEKITFTVTGNAVNGDEKADSGDKWNQQKYEVLGVDYGEGNGLPGFSALTASAATFLTALFVVFRKSNHPK